MQINDIHSIKKEIRHSLNLELQIKDSAKTEQQDSPFNYLSQFLHNPHKKELYLRLDICNDKAGGKKTNR
jgi:hypothetical protein